MIIIDCSRLKLNFRVVKVNIVLTIYPAKPEEENAFNLAVWQNCPFENHQGLI